ncbi:large ribosomal subunit protein uL30m-like [Saccoglossus kowalevskii]|uniref:Large ribosomal subunit protein uL30m n=1 Tax=Saccoglossus kowalevskii TaxID=10224 RepID=A0ABM0MJR5_SACKO|nr:PREDICTED: 39S ribosomal protein L30, mitochondrial-like [Saccoglossus kowalevskii]
MAATCTALWKNSVYNVVRLAERSLIRCHPVRTCFYTSHHRGQVRAKPAPLQLEDDDKEPHMLHAVYRIHAISKRPYWERNIIKHLGLDVRFNVVIHKNTPAVNEMLQAIKHLVRIQPVILKHGLPEDGDYDNTLLKNNGEFILTKKLKPLKDTKIENDV